MTGYNGTFAFEKPGDLYHDHAYLGMRVSCTALGAALVPFTFLTVWELTASLNAAAIAGSLVLFGKPHPHSVLGTFQLHLFMPNQSNDSSATYQLSQLCDVFRCGAADAEPIHLVGPRPSVFHLGSHVLHGQVPEPV